MLGDAYETEAKRLQIEVTKAKKQKVKRFEFDRPGRLVKHNELLSTDISQAVNEMSRMVNMFSKILKKLDEGQKTIIRNF